MTIEVDTKKIKEAADLFRRSRKCLQFLFPSITFRTAKKRVVRNKKYGVREIEVATCTYFNCTVDNLTRRSRREETIIKRSVFMHILYTYGTPKGETLAKMYGFDRTSFTHHAQVVADQLSLPYNNDYKIHVAGILSLLEIA